MKKNKIKPLLFIIIFIVFAIVFTVYNNNKKILVFNNIYMFDISNKKIKPIKKYPLFLNNSNIYYYSDSISYKGYMSYINKKANIDQVKGNSIVFYTEDYKKIDNYDLVVSNFNNLNIKKRKEIENSNISDEDLKIISEHINNNKEDLKVYKYEVDLDNNKVTDYIYVITNYYIYNDAHSLLQNNYTYYNYIIVRINNENKVLVSEEDAKVIYDLNNIVDVDNDNKYELNFSIEDVTNIYGHCETIHKYKDNKFIEYKNCTTEANNE